MNKRIYKFSLIFNTLFIIISLLFIYRYKEYIIQKLIKKSGEAEIVLFGDSIIKGGDWTELLNRNDVKNSGFPVYTTSHLTRIIKRNVIEYNPKICIIGAGINDINVGVPIQRIMINYQSMIDTLLTHNIKPIIQSTLYQENNPHNKILVDSLNYFLYNYCKKKSLHYLDINSELSSKDGLKSEFTIDGTHLTRNAYIIWGNKIKELLIEIESSSVAY
ncbi:GDSL-type esterase/lipase family protein [Ichthyenterobacterium sp. W332]|uniref:GDSL-type esterase/lipase family protein n=1 Tax=Microcosmobacter mediterraneus TaxID=3075607 RepID=A0ABU2YGP0_9FLAO|nr:GDSL-type esterase/lipase family protein [Ichthyenterobacterium sp. W332]MDT0557345.1 GDSL-type esterase/lipase family protein [Ichthyenterobacterium sp. W332]